MLRILEVGHGYDSKMSNQTNLVDLRWTCISILELLVRAHGGAELVEREEWKAMSCNGARTVQEVQVLRDSVMASMPHPITRCA